MPAFCWRYAFDTKVCTASRTCITRRITRVCSRLFPPYFAQHSYCHRLCTRPERKRILFAFRYMYVARAASPVPSRTSRFRFRSQKYVRAVKRHTAHNLRPHKVTSLTLLAEGRTGEKVASLDDGSAHLQRYFTCRLLNGRGVFRQLSLCLDRDAVYVRLHSANTVRQLRIVRPQLLVVSRYSARKLRHVHHKGYLLRVQRTSDSHIHDNVSARHTHTERAVFVYRSPRYSHAYAVLLLCQRRFSASYVAVAWEKISHLRCDVLTGTHHLYGGSLADTCRYHAVLVCVKHKRRIL